MQIGLLDVEVNNLTKILFLVVMAMALLMVTLKVGLRIPCRANDRNDTSGALQGFKGPWYRYFFRFVLLFSYIIPISLRVRLAWLICRLWKWRVGGCR